MKSTHKILIVGGAALTLFVLGRFSVGSQAASDAQAPGYEHEDVQEGEAALWTCPMHPQIKLPGPGACPICGMDLVQMTNGADDHPRQLVMSESAKALAQVQTQVVRRKNVTRSVRLVGKVDYDETAVRTISAWVPGRIDRLFVDYTGVRVSEGDHLVSLYSPELLTAQEELLSAKARVGATAGEASEFLSDSNRSAYTSSREKLLLWGLTEAQVVEIEERGSASDRVMLTSPSSGVVIEKLLDQGAYVETGTHIYRIADLSRLWLLFDAYEQDLPWLRFGQEVTFEIEALPGENFQGTISYIDPYIHDRTRTAKVRVNVDNSKGRLKPGMFVRAVASARLGLGGAVLDRHLAGKWVSPMHPEIVKDGPGQCDVCGMDLVRAEELGLVPDAVASNQRPVVVPSSAVLVTGKRAVVYIEVPGAGDPTYEGREIVLGPRAGDEYLVVSGLEEGERVVVNGAFRIDSSMQILAKPSMMSLGAETNVARGPAAAMFRAGLTPLLEAYLQAQQGLAADDWLAAQKGLTSMLPLVSDLSGAGLASEHRSLWSEEKQGLEQALARAETAQGIEPLRSVFEQVSTALIRVIEYSGQATENPLVEVFCPMAFDNRGAAWLQVGDSVKNPYFGASMLRCGDVRVEHATDLEGGASMSSEQGMGGHQHGAMEEGSSESDSKSKAPMTAAPLVGVFTDYLKLQTQLASDNAAGAHQSLGELLKAVVAATKDSSVPKEAMMHLHKMHSALMSLGVKDDIEAHRLTFQKLSEHLLAIEPLTGNPLPNGLQVVHCPMAFDDAGADWIQAKGSVANPYFGASMLTCGAVQRELVGQ